MTKIYIPFGGTITPAAPWDDNWINNSSLTSTGVKIADLLDEASASTGVSLTFDSAYAGGIQSGGYASAGTGEFTTQICQRTAYQSGPVQHTFAGLPSGGSYTLQVLGHNINNRVTEFTVEGVSQDYTPGPSTAPAAALTFSGTIDPDGQIVFGADLATVGGSEFAHVTAIILEYTAPPSSTTINVDIPLHINLKWDTTHQLAVTHDGGTTTLDGVTLSTPTGWETVTYSGSLPAGDSFASLAATDATLGGGGYTMQAGDILAWETQTGLTVDVNTTPVVSPAATVSGSYKIWNEVGQTWTSVSTFTINDLGEVIVGGGIPVADRVTFQAMVGYLITQGYQGAGNETIQKWLLAEGISKKSFNEMLRDYLTGLGYNGTLPEQLRDWRNG